MEAVEREAYDDAGRAVDEGDEAPGGESIVCQMEGEFGGVRDEEAVEELGDGCLGVADNGEISKGGGEDWDWVEDIGANDVFEGAVSEIGEGSENRKGFLDGSGAEVDMGDLVEWERDGMWSEVAEDNGVKVRGVEEDVERRGAGVFCFDGSRSQEWELGGREIAEGCVLWKEERDIEIDGAPSVGARC